MPNRLALETSPYLLQHSDNPVDWYPWGEEALRRAREGDRPILLSIGYSACHWCHVMERESFEDAATATFMNEHFVNVKVDREERPDLDAIYMEAVQAISGQGGWPLTAFLDPDAVPFFGGTYFPPEEGRGMPSFRAVMDAVLDAFANRRAEIRQRAPAVRERLAAIAAVEPDAGPPGVEELDGAVARLLASADRRRGGFGGAPKFPPAAALELLAARAATRGGAGGGAGGEEAAVVGETLDAMLAGGIYDQLGGGFARYSVDAEWLVPHFEKMLYDNAQLARAYLHGWQLLGHERHRRVCEQTLDWMLSEMRGPEGGFYSALDADSEGEEGRFYVWTADQVRAALAEGGAEDPANSAAEDAAPNANATEDAGGSADASGGAAAQPDPGAVLAYYGVSERGNFEGANVLHLAGGATAPAPPGLERARHALLQARGRRIRPGCDDKRLTAWNALAIAALAEAGAVLGRDDYLDAARRCAEFVLGSLRDAEGRLLRSFRDGDARLPAYLEDHAFLLEALLALYEASFEPRWFTAAQELGETMVARFGDPQRGGFFSTAADGERLIVRRKDLGDHPIPAGNSAAALALLRLAALSGERRYGREAESVLALFGAVAVGHPESFAHLLRALDLHLAPSREVALVAPPAAREGAELAAAVAPLAAVVRAALRPHLVLAAGPEGAEVPPLLAGRALVDGQPAAHVCEGFSCRLPVAEPERLRELL